MFSPRRAPKEGRTLPSYTRFNEGNRDRFSPRQITITGVIALCLFLGYFLFSTEASAINIKSSTSNPIPSSSSSRPATSNGDRDSSNRKSLGNTASDKVQALISNPLDKIQASADRLKSQPQQQSILDDEDASGDSKPKVKAEDFPKSKHPVSRETWAKRSQTDKYLDTVIAMMPDEVHMRELIRPVESTGKERMREMGLRTRAYKKYLDAWENLHITEDSEGGTYIRDDVIQYLIGQQQATSKDHTDTQALAQTIHTYESYRAFLKNFGKLLFPWTAPWFGDHMSFHTSFKKGGRGIVLTVGDQQAPYVLTTVYTFRKLGCTLPIEILYLGDADLDLDYRAELESLPGVVTRDIAQMIDDDGWRLAGWAAKPFAMLFSSFQEVIFIDADALFFRNPEILFDDPDYQKHGALFFRDRMIMPESKKRWLQQVLPKPVPKIARQSRFWTGESGHQMESGVMVVDKWKHFMSLMLVTRFNGPDRDGKKEKGIVGVYDMMYGDKETFWLGFLLAGDEDFAFHAGSAGILGELKVPDAVETKEKDSKDDPDGNDKPKENTTEQEALDAVPAAAGSKPSKIPLSSSSPSVPPTNFTICAPQLLHLDAQGKPLWFNGWLLKNKFADKSKKTFSSFAHYLIEPKDLREPTPWQLAEANMCCLTADEMHDFTAQEQETLQMIMDRAHEMGMGDQQ